MNRTTLLALAERVEAATRGSDELDAHIRCALFGKPNNFVKQSHINGAWCVWRIDGAGREVAWDGNGLTQLQRLGAFTASLDAAMSLYITIPERIPSNPRLATAEALRQRAIAGSLTDD